MSQKKRKGFFSWFQSKATTEVVKDEIVVVPSTEPDKTLKEIITPPTEMQKLVVDLAPPSPLQTQTTPIGETDTSNKNSLAEIVTETNLTSHTVFEALNPYTVNPLLNEETKPSPLLESTTPFSNIIPESSPINTSNETHPISNIAVNNAHYSVRDTLSNNDDQTRLDSNLSQQTLTTSSTRLNESTHSNQNIECNNANEQDTSTQISHKTEDTLEKKQGFFLRLKKRLSKTKQQMGQGLFSLFLNKTIDEDLFDEITDQLLMADVGVNTTQKLIDELKTATKKQKILKSEQLFSIIKQQMSTILQRVEHPLEINTHQSPMVILMVGVNGVGKTTTIGKLAKKFQLEGKKVMLAAGDTFRAAAVEQLQVWGERNNIPVAAQKSGGDAASVIFDAIQMAKARNIDILIADTAGRLQNKSHLMDELKKIVRVIKKVIPEAPHEIILTLDAGTGQNAIAQVKLFSEAVGLTGLILTKLDGTAKGGVIFGIADQYPIAIPYIGIGESIDDLRAFNAHDFIEAIFSTEG